MANTDIRGVTRAPTAQIWGPLIAVWVLWGSTYVGIAIMGRTLPPLVGNGLRFGVAAIALALILAISQGVKVLAITRAQFRGAATMGTALIAVGLGTVALSENHVPSGEVALLIAVTPLWIVVLRLLAGERPAALTLVGVAVGMGGLALMVLPGGTEPVAGSNDHDVVLWSIALLASSFVWAFFSWRAARYEYPKNPLTATVYQLAVGAMLLVVAGTLRGERVHLELVTSTTLWAGAFLVIASVVAYSAYSWLLRNAPMSLVSTYAYVNPVVAVFLGWLIIDESITSDVLLGLVVVVGGVTLVVTGERKK